ncbi:MAG: glycoside hydrolase family 127 protein [Clostridiales bacterium]|nr:glycoside hydrolase family 127 protein [Clostridiales bacterium]
MKCLLLANDCSDFSRVLESCGIEIVRMTFEDALCADVTPYDAYVIFGASRVLDPRLRTRLEEECAKGKRFLTEALGSWRGIYSAPPVVTTSRRLVVVSEEDEIPGLSVGDLLDDGSNRMTQPYYLIPGVKMLLAYRDHIIAHRHWNADPEDMRKGSVPGLWTVGDNLMMTSFVFHNFNRARLSPREAWHRLIVFLAKWITGREPAWFPEPVVRFGIPDDLTDDDVFARCREEAVEHGIRWLERYLIDEGRGGIREGLRHDIDPEGNQATADGVRTDCTGEAAGAFRFYGARKGDGKAAAIADNLTELVFGPMMEKGGLFDGMLRWTDTAWEVCYQDDAARAMLPALYNGLFLGDNRDFPAVCRALDFLVKTTAKDGCRVSRTDAPNLNAESLRALAEAEHGHPSAHYNAYYHAALLLAYRIGGNPTYLDVGRRGLETIMALYPDTKREQSETEEQCRLILPLAALYGATGEEKHRAMLYRVTDDLVTHMHPTGGISEWDTGYRANCSRESRGECSLLTENGDPVADLLYATNWLPVGFAYAYHVTGDERFHSLWRDVAAFCIRAQLRSDDPKTDGSWCRAFDMELGEAYGCPHDVGWAANCSESGWTDAEILMGLMMPEILSRAEKRR